MSGKSNPIFSKRLAVALIALSGLVWAPGAPAQEEGQTQVAPTPTLNVHSVFLPSSRAKLAAQGVTITAGCGAACTVVATVSVSGKVAGRIGVKPVLGTGSARAVDDLPVTFTVKIKKSARRPLAEYRGGGQLHVQIDAQP